VALLEAAGVGAAALAAVVAVGAEVESEHDANVSLARSLAHLHVPACRPLGGEGFEPVVALVAAATDATVGTELPESRKGFDVPAAAPLLLVLLLLVPPVLEVSEMPPLDPDGAAVLG